MVGGGEGGGCGPETMLLPAALEGGVISPPFGGVALPVAIAAGVPHVVQRHHHLVWVRVFVQFHHARHHRGPAICSEHVEVRVGGECTSIYGAPTVYQALHSDLRGEGLITPISQRWKLGSERSRCLPRSTQERTGPSEFRRERESARALPRVSRAECGREAQARTAAKDAPRSARPTLPFPRHEH